ncbi:kinesin motor domain-containing protein [Haematococcus lacustris]|uniref:Kinesin motor domain-containing protein n=1 Tax=Haematococcus lacustris TaxID=44745 RepID=A0A699YD72_HAELA|nr:kinesin motor domain-containing protein [Haematococcus lacustris]
MAQACCRAHKIDQTTSTNATVTSPCLSKGPMASIAQASSTATSTSHALVEPSGSTATMSVAQSAGASLGLSDTCDGALGWDPGRVREVLRTQKAAVTKWYKAELRRMQAEFRASAAADIAALRSALEATQDQADRLDVQKQLLLHQASLHCKAAASSSW